MEEKLYSKFIILWFPAPVLVVPLLNLGFSLFFSGLFYCVFDGDKWKDCDVCIFQSVQEKRFRLRHVELSEKT